jgi:hypothetical protein
MPEHIFFALLNKPDKTDVEKMALMAVIQSANDQAFEKLTMDQVWDKLLADHDKVFKARKNAVDA